MRKRIIVLLSLLAISCAPGRAAESPTLRVLSYNIHHGEGADGRLDLARIAQVILRAEADLVALQEVDQATRRSRGVDQAAELARLTQMHALFAGNLPFQGGQYGNAVLSRWPASAHRHVPLPSRNQGEPRGVLVVDVTWPAPQISLRLLATHLDHRRDDAERWESAARINQLAQEQSEMPSLLVGDLNDTRGSRVLSRLAQHWTIAGQQPAPTIPVDRPTRQIDFVLYRPTDAWRVVEVKVLEEPVASDHRPILAVLAPRTRPAR